MVWKSVFACALFVSQQRSGNDIVCSRICALLADMQLMQLAYRCVLCMVVLLDDDAEWR